MLLKITRQIYLLKMFVYQETYALPALFSFGQDHGVKWTTDKNIE